MNSDFLLLAGLLFLYMNGWFFVSLIKKRNDVADVAWGLGFVILSWASILMTQVYDLRSMLVTGLVTLWGLRLSWHIHQRHQGKPEDARYQAWREAWKKHFYLRSYLQVYLLQGVFLFMIATPIFWIHQASESTFGWVDILGLAIWTVGFLFESVGDWQLGQFLKNPQNRGKLMTLGLWQYTRHPNYFGEVTQWWGIWLMALSTPHGWMTLIGPLTISFLILKVSGIPMLEEKMLSHPDFPAYKKRVSKFFPWWPK